MKMCNINKPLNQSSHAPLWLKGTSAVNSTKMIQVGGFQDGRRGGASKKKKKRKTPQLADLSANGVDSCWISRQHLLGALFSPAVAPRGAT